MADEDYEMDGGYDDEPIEPELDEGANEELEADANKEDDFPDPILADGEDKQEQEQGEQARKTSKYTTNINMQESWGPMPCGSA